MRCEKDTCKYLEMLEAETIKQAEMKEKNILGEREIYWKPNYVAEISSND